MNNSISHVIQDECRAKQVGKQTRKLKQKAYNEYFMGFPSINIENWISFNARRVRREAWQ